MPKSKKLEPLASHQPKPLAAIFCGDRDWDDHQAVLDVMDHYQPSLVIQGDARGADRIAGICADFMGIPQRVFPANWEKYHRAAGPLRNQEMLFDLLHCTPGHTKRVFAFHDNLAKSKGTADMVKRAKKAGIRVTLIRHKKRGKK